MPNDNKEATVLEVVQFIFRKKGLKEVSYVFLEEYGSCCSLAILDEHADYLPSTINVTEITNDPAKLFLGRWPQYDRAYLYYEDNK